MKSITTLLLAITVTFTTSCSRNGGDGSQATNSKGEESFPEEQVVEIFGAVIAKDVAKATALLQTNPKLVRAKYRPGDLNVVWGHTVTVLLVAAKQGDEPMVELLLESGANVNEKSDHDSTALHFAAMWGHLEVVQLLLDHKADVNVKNSLGATPLANAKETKSDEVVALLKQHGASE